MNTADGSGRMFDRIAHRYDLVNRIISGGNDTVWRRRLIDCLAPPDGGRVLDLATGTADVAIGIAQRFPSVTVLGTDPSIEMLAIGRRKIENTAEGTVELEPGNAETINLPDDAVDAVTMAFGIRNVGDREAALREMNRVCRPGGTIALLELSSPSGSWMSRLAGIHVQHVVPLLGGLLSGKSEYRYLEHSIAAFPAPADFAAMMERAGITNVSVRPFTFGTVQLFAGHAGTKQ